MNTENVNKGIIISGGSVTAQQMAVGDNAQIKIGQLENSDASQASQIADLLNKLKTAIENEQSLDADDKIEALKQVEALAEAGKNPSDEGMKKQAKRGVTMLRGIVTALQPTAALLTICKDLLPMIGSFFGL